MHAARNADAHQQRFKVQIKHPSKWTKEEVANWFNGACNGVFQRKGAPFACLLPWH